MQTASATAPRHESPTAGPTIRATGILIEDGRVLLEHVRLRERSNWSLPGGTLEQGETLHDCLVREMLEETGIVIEVDDLLYVCDRFRGLGRHVLDMSFSVHRAADTAGTSSLAGRISDDRITCVRMVPIGDLCAYGFSARFRDLVAAGFPGKGGYMGDFHTFYDDPALALAC